MDRIGRKKACILTCLILLLSWTTAAFTTSDKIYLFFGFRILAGIGGGKLYKIISTIDEYIYTHIPEYSRNDYGQHDIRVRNQPLIIQAALVVPE